MQRYLVVGSMVPLALLAFAASPAVQADEAQRTIRVSGEGKAASPPDMATIHTGVVTRAKNAGDALAANNAAMQQILAVLSEHKIAAKDVQTSAFAVQPEYKRGPRGEMLPEIVGYRVTNQVRVRVRNLPQLGEVLDSLVSAGSNQVSGVSFGVDDPTGVLNQARNRAIADAKSRAALYAQAAGVGVGRVLSISEGGVAVPRGEYLRAEAAGAAVPIATGEQEFTATVQMVFALEDK